MRARLPVEPLRSRSALGNQGTMDEHNVRALSCIHLQTVLCLRPCQAGLRFVRLGSWFSPRSWSSCLSTPHDGFRWWIVSNVVCGLRGNRHVPTVFTRSINLRPFGTSLPARPARTQFRQWPPVSIDSQFLISRASASALQSCARWQRQLFGTHAAQPIGRPRTSTSRSVSLV